MIYIANKIIYGANGEPLIRTGYADAGASTKKRALKGFNPISADAVLDIDANNDIMRQRSRMLYMAAPIATSAIKTNRTNVIGCGLKLKSRLNREILGIDPDEATRIEKGIEVEFSLWASHKRSCDATGVNDFYAMQQLCFTSWLLSGDAFVMVKQGDTSPLIPYSLRLHVIEADRISTPPNGAALRTGFIAIDGKPYHRGFTEGVTENGNVIHDGVEVSETGEIKAYHVCDGLPAFRKFGRLPQWTRVEAYGENTGLPNILQITDTERPDQYRGVPYLAAVIEPLLQLRRYTESEQMAAVVESFFTAFIKVGGDTSTLPWNEAGHDGDYVSSDPNDLEMGPGMINVLKPGEDIEFGDPKRPSSGFESFVKAMSRQIGAALEVPADLLLKAFDASYSASRAALLEAWKAFKMRREWFVSDFCNPVYEIWFSEAVARGRIDAPGFFDDPLIRASWLSCEWIGPSQGQLDPVKEITAEKLAIAEGITTREQATVRINGGSWDSNLEQLEKENRLLNAANLPTGDNKTTEVVQPDAK